jgi:hypothetical protein
MREVGEWEGQELGGAPLWEEVLRGFLLEVEVEVEVEGSKRMERESEECHREWGGEVRSV